MNKGIIGKKIGMTQIFDEKGNVIPKIKLSNDTVKIVNPDYKKLYRAYSKSTGYALADIMCRKNEDTNERKLTLVSTMKPLKKNIITDFELVELQKPIFKRRSTFCKF